MVTGDHDLHRAGNRRAREAQSTTGVNLGAAPAVPGPQHPGRSRRPKRLNRTPRIVFRTTTAHTALWV
jgi:hypothetical protein